MVPAFSTTSPARVALPVELLPLASRGSTLMRSRVPTLLSAMAAATVALPTVTVPFTKLPIGWMCLNIWWSVRRVAPARLSVHHRSRFSGQGSATPSFSSRLSELGTMMATLPGLLRLAVSSKKSRSSSRELICMGSPDLP